jgi:hypothetical protein
VAQGEGPELKPQYLKKTKNKPNQTKNPSREANLEKNLDTKISRQLGI